MAATERVLHVPVRVAQEVGEDRKSPFNPPDELVCSHGGEYGAKKAFCYLPGKYWLWQRLIFIMEELTEPALDCDSRRCARSVYSREGADSVPEPDPEFLSTVRVDNGIRSL